MTGGKPAEPNKFLGLREGDLKRLRGDSLIYKNGHCYVIVDKGKGGKYQEQHVCDKDVADVQKFFDGSHRKLFIAGDFGRNFDYHGQRREYAMNICAYYTEQAKDPKFRKELYKEVATQWHQLNKKASRPSRTVEFFRQAICPARQKQGFSHQTGSAVDSRPAGPASHERSSPRALAR